MTSAGEAIRILHDAAEINEHDPLRRGSTLYLPDYGQVVMTGDLHGHRRNFERLQTYAALSVSGARHVILHELIHEELQALDSQDASFDVQLDAARWKCEYPDQVHFLQSNHELSQLTGHEIAKNGRVVTYEFDREIRRRYPDRHEDVSAAIKRFIRSFSLAARTRNRLFLSHSLPGPRDVSRFNPAVLDRTPTDMDFSDGSSAFLLVWGRYQTAESLDQMSRILDADYFVCGHQPQEDGFGVLHDRMLILASDHSRGVFLPIDLNKPIGSIHDLTSRIIPFAEIE